MSDYQCGISTYTPPTRVHCYSRRLSPSRGIAEVRTERQKKIGRRKEERPSNRPFREHSERSELGKGRGKGGRRGGFYSVFVFDMAFRRENSVGREMEREREKIRDTEHKTMLKELKKEKLWIKDEINRLTEYDYDQHQGGVESFR